MRIYAVFAFQYNLNFGQNSPRLCICDSLLVLLFLLLLPLALPLFLLLKQTVSLCLLLWFLFCFFFHKLFSGQFGGVNGMEWGEFVPKKPWININYCKLSLGLSCFISPYHFTVVFICFWMTMLLSLKNRTLKHETCICFLSDQAFSPDQPYTKSKQLHQTNQFPLQEDATPPIETQVLVFVIF